MRLLLTGGTGFLGGVVARLLQEAGHDVILLARPGRAPEDLARRFRVATGDVTDPASLVAALGGDGGQVQGVVHLAALVQMWIKDRSQFDRVNVQGLDNVLQAARHAGVERVLYSSSFMALGPSAARPLTEEDDPRRDTFFNDYERTKYLADQLARKRIEEGYPLLMVYPGVVYGPGTLTAGGLVTRQVIEFLRGKLPGILGPGDLPVCYSYIEDVARGIVLALEKGEIGRGYILGGENATLNELMQTIARVSGKPAPKRHIPYGVVSAIGRLQWWMAELFGKQPEVTHQVVNIYRNAWAYDSARAERELGYTVTPLQEGMDRTVRWLRETGLDG